MKTLARLVAPAAVAATIAVAVAVAATGMAAANASAQAPQQATVGIAAGVVFVQNDDPSGSRVFAYDRAADGTLTPAGSYPTGGNGGVLSGSVIDHLASQGALALDRAHSLLFAVNAGSDTLSVFAVRGDQLGLLQVVPSGGTFPVSIARHGRLVYVLNAREGGTIAGFRISGHRLVPVHDSIRPLGLDPSATPEFTNTPGQVAFSPDGSQLLVTTKANGNSVDVFAVRADGRTSSSPVANVLPGAVPFALVFDSAGHVVLTEAGPNAVETFGLGADGTLAPLETVATGQAATCWVAEAGGFFYASNAGSASLSGYAIDSAGHLTSLGNTATDPGTVDAAASPDGRFLYVETGANGIVDAMQVGPTGTLTPIGSVTVPGAVGAEGIAVG